MSLRDKEARKKYNREYYKEHPFSASYKLHRQKIALLRKQKIRKEIDDYKKSHPCQRCNESHIICLDFHHKEGKESCIADAIRKGWSLERVLKEIKKCIILCANCHRAEHASI